MKFNELKMTVYVRFLSKGHDFTKDISFLKVEMEIKLEFTKKFEVLNKNYFIHF